MGDDDRDWLLKHLDEQAAYLKTLTEAARANPDEPSRVFGVCDEVFTMRETLDTLGVPYARADNDAWNRISGTEMLGD